MNKQRWKVLVTVIGVISSVIAWLIYPFTKLGSTWHAIAVAIVMMVVFHLLTKAVLRKWVARHAGPDAQRWSAVGLLLAALLIPLATFWLPQYLAQIFRS